MKRCRKSTPEPPSLTTFRTANPTGRWDELRNDACYGDIRDATRRDQGGLCAYCELSLTDDNEQIAHFHPKSDTAGAINWALRWENLWLACKGGTQTHHNDPASYLPPLPNNRSCDENKTSNIVDGHVLSPEEVPLFPRVFRFEQQPNEIRIVPDEDGCKQAGIPVKKAQNTIDVFNLNCQRLAVARLSVYRSIESTLKKLRESSFSIEQKAEKQRQFAARHLSMGAGHRWPRFFTLLRWQFGMIAETHLNSLPYQG